MKKLILLFLPILLFSCSSDDSVISDDTQQISSIVNDLQGTWFSDHYINQDGENRPYQSLNPNGEPFSYTKTLRILQDSLFYKNDVPVDYPRALLVTGEYIITIEDGEVIFNSYQCHFDPLTGLKKYDFTPGPATIIELTETRFVLEYFLDTVFQSVFIKE